LLSLWDNGHEANMKAALTTITVPYSISFMAGMFDWTFDDGFYMLIGFAMLAGIIWAWIAEVRRK